MSLAPPPSWTDGEASWAWLCRHDPGLAVALFLEAHRDVDLEPWGPNKGPLLKAWLPDDPRALDGQPTCAAVPISLADRAGARRMGGSEGLHWFWDLRATRHLPGAFAGADAWALPNCPPYPGAMAVWKTRRGSDAGRGGHADMVLGYDAASRMVTAVGVNLSDSIKVHSFELGDPALAGFGYFRPR